MPRFGLPYTLNQPVWWLAQQEPDGLGVAPLMGQGALGGSSDLMGDGVLGGDAMGDGVMGQRRLGGGGQLGGGTGWPGSQPWTIPRQDLMGGGLMGTGLLNDARMPFSNPWLDSGSVGGFSPAEWGDLDPDPQQPGGPARYSIFGGGTCALADGTALQYGAVPSVIQGGPFVTLIVTNTTGTAITYATIKYTIIIWAVRPVWPGNRRLRVILQWVASGVGWYDWDGSHVPAGAALYQAVADLDDTGCGTAWPTVTGTWPASVTVGGVTSPCPAAGAFTVRT